nr:hypothetical protein [candidate division Zixibacteria bacterium]
MDLGKGFWWSLLIAVILAVLIAYENQTFSISAVAQLTPLLVYYFASEMVLRAILITRIIKIFGHTTAASILAVIISAVIFAITHEPYSGSVTAMFIMSVLLSGVYLAFHSILLMVIAGLYTSVVYATAGNSQFSYLPLVIIMTLVLYIILAIPARLIGNRHKSFPQPE